MNKVILSGEDTTLNIENYTSEIVVQKLSKLSIYDIKDNLNLYIRILDGATLVFNMFSVCNNLNIKLSVVCENQSKFILNNTIINSGKYNLSIKTNLLGNNIENSVNIRGINEQNGSITILMEGIDYKNTSGNVISEYAKIINKSDYQAVLIPNLIVDSCDITANHGVSIGSISSDDIFYLETKGIEKNEAKKILELGYILEIMDGEEKEIIKKILMGR